MSKFTTHVEDDEGVKHDVLVTYKVTPFIPEMRDTPHEGGVEIWDVVCGIHLSPSQMREVEAECVEYARIGGF